MGTRRIQEGIHFTQSIGHVCKRDFTLEYKIVNAFGLSVQTGLCRPGTEDMKGDPFIAQSLSSLDDAFEAIVLF
jgi:hypothetical protein